ncbi:hypothetical protein PVAP13_3KG126511 [Panicum virgatum]|uniref:Uncharacterized protein n=1 Tax=Panicum virgatum TaxID=38727 RepID=A0A8T0UT96_PANVG|nr:hypothetical protein PVAP13_3KG126511 [Panicum virgatum]
MILLVGDHWSDGKGSEETVRRPAGQLRLHRNPIMARKRELKMPNPPPLQGGRREQC